jgi:hypothetical protein
MESEDTMRQKKLNAAISSPVAKLINDRITSVDWIHVPQQVIASAVGYNGHNNISMVRMGRSKLPMDKAVKLAEFVGIPTDKLVLLCIKEYLPDTYYALDTIGILPKCGQETEAVAQLLRKMRVKVLKDKAAALEALD